MPSSGRTPGTWRSTLLCCRSFLTLRFRSSAPPTCWGGFCWARCKAAGPRSATWSATPRAAAGAKPGREHGLGACSTTNPARAAPTAAHGAAAAGPAGPPRLHRDPARTRPGQPAGAGCPARDRGRLAAGRAFPRAETYHVSLPYVSALVRQATGSTFKELLQQKRLDRAQRLLRTTALPCRPWPRPSVRDDQLLLQPLQKTIRHNAKRYRARLCNNDK